VLPLPQHANTHLLPPTQSQPSLPKQNSEGIVRWVKKKTGPAAATLADKDALAAAEKEHEIIVVAYYKELKVRARVLCVRAVRGVCD
jgi:hypothetical protein